MRLLPDSMPGFNVEAVLQGRRSLRVLLNPIRFFAALGMLSTVLLAVYWHSPWTALVVLGLSCLFLSVAYNDFKKLQRELSLLKKETSALQDRYHVLTENLAASVIIRDKSGSIIYCSPYTEVLTGYSLSDIYAAKPDFFHTVLNEDDKDLYRRAQGVAAAGEAFQFRFRFYHKTGLEMWAETRTVPILDRNGEAVSSLSIMIDVTATVLHQKQVETRNREIQDFTYMVSHDLKAPIFTIKGMLEVIREDSSIALAGDSGDALSHIGKACNRLEHLVSSVLEYSKLSTLDIRLAPIPLSLVFQDIKDDFQNAQAKGELSLLLPQEFPEVLGERVCLYQVFSNLVNNAFKYRDPTRNAEIKISVSQPRNHRFVTISVSDNGLGIPQDKFEVIFRPFHRAHAGTVEGSGIGLAAVTKLLEKLGGEIQLSSEPGKGSCFSVTLRRAFREEMLRVS